MKGSTSRAEGARPPSAREHLPQDDTCDNCENGLLDITDVFRQGLATLPPGVIVGGEGFSLEECFHAAELPLPLENKEIWLPNQSRVNKRERLPSSRASGEECDARADADSSASQLETAGPPPPSSSLGGGLARDGSSLVPYLRLQAAAASGMFPMSAQAVVMQRLLLWLLPLLQGSSPPRTFLRCLFFKKPVPPIVQACEEDKWNHVEASTAGGTHALDLALTNNLPLLQCFCAVYARLCLRIQTLNDFGGQEFFVYEEDCEMSNCSSPWNGLQSTGWQDEGSLSAETEREDLQQYTDRVEQTCALYAVPLWGVDDTCVEALLQWEPSEGEASRLADSPAAPKTRQERVLRMLLREAETDRDDQGSVQKACRFLCCLALLVEAIIVASRLESLESSPYDFGFYLANGFLQGSIHLKKRDLPKRGQKTILHTAFSCLFELFALLHSKEWWLHSHARPDSSSSAASGDAACTPDFDVDLSFTPLFAHFRDPIQMTAEPLPSVPFFCQTMLHFLQQLHRFISCKWQSSEVLKESEEPLPLHEALPRALMDELFACFAKEDGDRLRVVTWDLRPSTVPPFPEGVMHGERERSSRQQPLLTTEERSGSARSSSEEASQGEGKHAPSVERKELPTCLLRVYSYLSLTTVPGEIEGAWLVGRFKAWRPLQEARGRCGITEAPTALESALACICWGCGCDNCETWGRWKWSLQEFVLSLYAGQACMLLNVCSNREVAQTLHMAPHRQVRHLQGIRTKPQAFVEETIRLLGASRNPWTKCLKGTWALCPPSSQMKAQAVAVAFDAMLLQQQHSLALTVSLQLASPAEEVVIYWSLFNVLASSEEVRRWQLVSSANEDADEIARPTVDCSVLSLFAYAQFLFAVASRFRLRQGQTLREALWPFYCVRCAPLYLAMQPLWAARNMLEEAPHWMGDESARARSDVTSHAAAASDAHFVAKLAKLSANMMQRFSFETLCDSVEALSSVRRNALASAKLHLQEAVGELTKEGGQARTSLDQAILDALRETLWRLR